MADNGVFFFTMMVEGIARLLYQVCYEQIKNNIKHPYKAKGGR